MTCVKCGCDDEFLATRRDPAGRICVLVTECNLRAELRMVRTQYAVLRDAAEDFVRRFEEADAAPVPDRVWIALCQHALKEPWPTDTRYIVERIEVAACAELRNLRAAVIAIADRLDETNTTGAARELREACKVKT